jgi:murein DD-endopeptidase MepM/ murein hydrolase activator NlpD
VLAEVSAGAGTAVDAVLAGRERALSRGLPRQALRQVAERQLQQAAESQARRRSAALADLAAGAAKQADRLRRLSWRLPVRRGAYHLTAGFGECSWLWSHCHTGLDFAADEGTPIHAVAAGVVRRVGWAGAYGYRTIETLPDGTRLWYCHQSATDVRAGQQVRAGEVIGAVGSTGNVTGPHVHLEVRPTPGHPVDPKQALVAHGVKP